MKNIIVSTIIVSSLFLFGSCQDELNYTPTGVLSSSDLTSPAAIDGLVTSAYAAIGNGDMIGPIYSDWVYGSVRSDDAYKGGGGASGFSTYVTKKAFETAKIVMSRRQVEFSEQDQKILEHVFEETSKYRKE